MFDRFNEPSFAERPIMKKFRRQLLEDALVFYEGAVRDDSPTEFAGRFDKVQTFRELAGFQIVLGKRDEALQTLRRAFTLLDGLEAERPDDPSLALEHIDILTKKAFASEGRIDECAAIYREAIIRADLALRLHPDSLLLGDALAWTKENLGDILRQSGQLVEAGLHISEAVEIRQKLLKTNPDDLGLKSRLADGLCKLGNNRTSRKLFDEAEGYYAKADELFEPLLKAHPENYLWQLGRGRLYLNWGLNDLLGKPIDQAIERYRAGVGQAEALVRVVPEWPEALVQDWQLNAMLAEALVALKDMAKPSRLGTARSSWPRASNACPSN